jgi:hypothetical protein
MELDFLLDRDDLITQPLVERVYRIHLGNLPQEPPPGSCSISKFKLSCIPQQIGIFFNCLPGETHNAVRAAQPAPLRRPVGRLKAKA